MTNTLHCEPYSVQLRMEDASSQESERSDGSVDSVENATERDELDREEGALLVAEADKSERLSARQPVASQQPHSRTEDGTQAEAAAVMALDDDGNEEVDEQLIVRHRKRARMVSESDEEEAGGVDGQQQQPHRPQQPHTARQSRSQPLDCDSQRGADAFDFEQYSAERRAAESTAGNAGGDGWSEDRQADIDIFALLRREAKHSREAAERRQRQARQEVEHSLTGALINEQRRQDEEGEGMRRAGQTQDGPDEDEEDDEGCCY